MNFIKYVFYKKWKLYELRGEWLKMNPRWQVERFTHVCVGCYGDWQPE